MAFRGLLDQFLTQDELLLSFHQGGSLYRFVFRCKHRQCVHLVGSTVLLHWCFQLSLPQPYTWFITESGWRVCGGSAASLLGEGKGMKLQRMRASFLEKRAGLQGCAEGCDYECAVIPVLLGVAFSAGPSPQCHQGKASVGVYSWFRFGLEERGGKHEGICRENNSQLSQEHRELKEMRFSSWMKMLGTDKILSPVLTCGSFSTLFPVRHITNIPFPEGKSWWP